MASKKLPKLIVFDLDYTLWPFFVDSSYTRPFRLNEQNHVVDHRGRRVPHYPGVPAILTKLTSMNITLAIASRTSEIQGARELVNLFGWKKYFKYSEIYPGSKVKHFNEFKKNSGLEFSEMLFFDDEERNIHDLTRLGVTSILVSDGMTMSCLENGLDLFDKQITSH